MTKSLTEIIKSNYVTTKSGKNKVKYNPFQWIEDCEKTFQDLKQAFMTASVLAHYNPKLETWIKTDSSNFVTAGVLLQMHNGVLRLVAYFSKKLTSVECNYMIYNKKLLAIVKSFKIWHPELASAADQVKVYTNHRNLEYFMITKQLNWQQACWAEFLSEFNFKIMYKSDKQRGKPDMLMQRSQDIPKKMENLRWQHQFQTLQQDNQLDENIKKALAVMFCAGNAREKVNINEDIIDAEDYLNDNMAGNNNLATDWESANVKPRNYEENTEDSLEELFANAYKNDKLVQAIIDAKIRGIRKLPRKILKQVKLSIRNLEVKNSRLYVRGKIYVPDNKNL